MFDDRKDAGEQLAEQLKNYQYDNLIILALPRGGVVVGFEVARKLGVPLDIIISRKLGSPNNPEFGVGALAEDGSIVLDNSSIKGLGITEKEIKNIKEKEFEEIKKRIGMYRAKRSMLKLKDRVIILVDDGVATGVTARAAIEMIKRQKPKKLIFAVPVCSYQTSKEIRSLIDEMICIITPDDLTAIGIYYRNFTQVTDKEVLELLKKSKNKH